MRNLLALPYLARGTPMLAMGAELGHSQNGNNNAYAQDNATTWIDWAKADAGLIAFVGRLASDPPRPSGAVAPRLAQLARRSAKAARSTSNGATPTGR